MSRHLRFVRLVPFTLALLASASLNGCGGDDCPDVSGTWHLTAVCSQLGMPRAEEWVQDECNIVRKSTAGEEVGAATVGEDGSIEMTHRNTAAPCKGSVKGDVIEASCPGAVGVTCGPDNCCVARWSR
jgi:hypothetical protein